ncbi:hypothetical protein ACC761_14970 [Rhizobium ruizarguesonis]
MTQREIKHIDGGSPEYWRQRTERFRLIREAERARAHERVKHAPMYISGGYDEVENLGPWDPMDAAIWAIEANETAVNTLIAQRRTEIGLWRINAVIRELDQAEAAHGADPEGYPLSGDPALIDVTTGGGSVRLPSLRLA